MNIITIDDLTQAIKNSINNAREMADEQAYELAHHVLNFFGYSDRIIDNVLEPEDRDAFYMLEDAGILTTEREETTLYDGREWRIHYWLLRRDHIEALMSQIRVDSDGDHTKDTIYNDLPDDVWHRNK